MPNCLADNISLYCGDPYERFACILVYEDLFTRAFATAAACAIRCPARLGASSHRLSERCTACVLMVGTYSSLADDSFL